MRVMAASLCTLHHTPASAFSQTLLLGPHSQQRSLAPADTVSCASAPLDEQGYHPLERTEGAVRLLALPIRPSAYLATLIPTARTQSEKGKARESGLESSQPKALASSLADGLRQIIWH